MARILIAVHGMGVNKSDWSKGVAMKLNAVSRRYKAFEKSPDTFLLASGPDDTSMEPTPDQVLVIPAGYDAEMRARAEDFQRDTTRITEAAATAGITLPSELVSVLKWFSKAGETEKNFFWTHVVDVLIYHYFPLVTKQIRVVVMETMAKVLARPNVDVSIIGYSLGTAVAHDVLSNLGNGIVPGLGSLMPPGVRFVNVFMVANVSRVLEKTLTGDMDVYASCVCPISVRGDDAYCGDYYNFRHMLDPFTVPKRFEPQWVGNDYHPIDRLLHVGNFNVHDWDHYLDNPEVHIPILNSFFGFKVIDDDTAFAAIENYKVSPVPLCDKGLEFWIKETRKIAKKIEQRPTVPELLRTAAQFLAVAEVARAMCGAAPKGAGPSAPRGN